MPRTLPAAVLAALDDGVVRFVPMVRFDFDSGVLALHVGRGSVVYDGVTFLSSNNLLAIGDVAEGAEGGAPSLSITVSGIDTTLRALLQTEPYLYRTASVHMCLTDDSFMLDPAAVFDLFFGSITDISYQETPAPTFGVTLQSRLADLARSQALKLTDADQQFLYPGDKGLEFVAQMAQMKIAWPRAEFLPDIRKA